MIIYLIKITGVLEKWIIRKTFIFTLRTESSRIPKKFQA